AAVLAAAATLLWRARAPRGRTGGAAARLAGPGVAAAALVVLVAFDLGTVSGPVLARATGPLATILAAPEPELAKIGAREPRVRVSSTRDVAFVPGAKVVNRRDYEFYSNDWIRWRAHTLGGTQGARPALWQNMSKVTRSYAVMCAFGVAYMSADPGPLWPAGRYDAIFQRPREIVYRLRGPLGRAYAVPEVIAPGNDVLVIHSMMSPGFDPAYTAFTSDPEAAGEYPGARGCRIGWIVDDPDRVILETEAADRAFLMLADAWFPGWRARVDGADAPIHRVNQLVRGVVVGAGRHRVEMTFEPGGWAVGVRLTRIGLLAAAALALAWAVWEWRDRRGATVFLDPLGTRS